jgi:hypothetical protein
VRLEQLSQPRDVLVQGGGSVLRLVIAPELLDQAVTRDDAARPEQQEGEQAPLLDASQAKLPLAFPDLERTKDAKVEAARQTPTVPGVSAAS